MRIRTAIICALLLVTTRAHAAEIQNLRFKMPDGTDVGLRFAEDALALLPGAKS